MKNAPEIVDGFRMRGREVTRLEGFSDAVFGFALTLLVVSLDVPKTFTDLANTMRGFPAFAVCFVFLAIIWNGHYKFCRRFGLDDGPARLLTCVMLFLVLFYIYPLKFLFTLSINSMLFGGTAETVMTRDQFSDLMIIYGLGFAAVYLAFVLLYVHAYRLRERLELTELEKFETRYQIFRLTVLVGTGLFAAVWARTGWAVQWSGFAYLILIPIRRISGVVHRRKRVAFLATS